MARYRKIDPRIWNDEKFSALSHEAQRMFFFCLTHPSMTALGAFRITKSGMAEELGLSGKGFAEPFGELFRKGLVNYDERAFLLFVPNFLKYNAPENPNVVRGWVSSLDLLPECPLKTQVLARAKACTADNDALSKAFDKAFGRVAETLSPTLSKGLAKPLPKGMPKQEQEQEQDIYTHSTESSASVYDSESQPKKKTSIQKPEGVEQKDWDDYLKLRKQKRSPITERALNLLQSEGKKAGMTLQQVIVKCLEKSWVGFEAEWLSGQKQTQPPKKSIFAVEPSKDEDGWADNARYVQGVLNGY